MSNDLGISIMKSTISYSYLNLFRLFYQKFVINFEDISPSNGFTWGLIRKVKTKRIFKSNLFSSVGQCPTIIFSTFHLNLLLKYNN